MKYVNEAYDFVNHAWSKGKIQKLIAPLEGLAYCNDGKRIQRGWVRSSAGGEQLFQFLLSEGKVSRFFVWG